MASEEEKKKPQKDTSAKRVMDVAQPGKTLASATSRPLIVKHGAMLKDPMVATSEPSDNKAEEKNEDASSKKQITVSPIHDESEKQDDEDAKDEKIENEAAPETTASDNDTNDPVGGAAVDVLANEAVKKKKHKKQDHEKQELIKKHIEEKTYFAPVGQISKRRAKVHTLIAVLLLLVALAGVYLAIDAELIEVSFSLPIEFIQ